MEELDIATIGKRSVHGVIALVSRSFVLQLISFGVSLVIFSVLSKTDVGIYTAVIAIQRVISFFTDFGLGAALIQKKDQLTDEDIKTTFTFQSLVTFAIFLIVFIFRNSINSFFHLNDDASLLLLILVFSIFLSSFKTIPAILLERSIRFEKLIIPQLIESLTFNIILLFMVLNKFGLTSYSAAFLISSLIGIPAYYFVSPWKFGIGISKTSLHHLRFGTQFQAKNILATIKDDLLTVILVRFLSFTEIGYIGFAQRLAFFTFRYIVDSVTKVTFSTYSRIQESKEYLKSAIEKSLFFVGSLMFPALFGLIVISPYLISYFPKWSNKWEPAILSLVFFCLNAAVSSLSNVLVNVLDATGRAKTTLRLMIIWTVLTWILTPLFIYFYGFNGVAIASFLVTLTIFFTVYLVKKVVRFDLLKSIYKPFFSATVMVFVVYFTSKIFVHDLISLVLVILIGGGVYILSMFAIAKNQLSSDIKKVFLKQ